MTSYGFPERVKTLFSNADWEKERNVDLSVWTQEIEQELGYVLFDEAIRFLKIFGGLKMTIYHPSESKRIMYAFDFNPVDGMYFNAEENSEWKTKTKEMIYPIGAWRSEGVFITETGKIIIGETTDFSVLGNSVEESFENFIFHQEKLLRITGD